MLLAVDIGNIHIGLGVHDGKRWVSRFRVRTVPEKTPDEYAVLLEGLLGQRGLALREVAGMIVASVVPPLTEVFRKLCEEVIGCRFLALGPGVRTGLDLRVDHPAEVGADLVANAVAAYARFGDTCIVVDFGTATTFSAVAAQGAFLGVAIAPGLEVAAEALAHRAAQLPMVPLSPPRRAIGRNTRESMQSGLIYGYVGLVEGLIRLIRAELGGEARTIATGAYAEPIVALTELIEIHEPWLTLEGLRLIAERNRYP
ncbi:type III pantothenate kinase [Candidatus Bipolaricaulota sp. J31]